MKGFFHEENGQTTTEYILILAVVVMVVVKFRQKFTDQLKITIDKVGTDMNKATEDINN